VAASGIARAGGATSENGTMLSFMSPRLAPETSADRCSRLTLAHALPIRGLWALPSKGNAEAPELLTYGTLGPRRTELRREAQSIQVSNDVGDPHSYTPLPRLSADSFVHGDEFVT
jgi:hypothetical protein